MERGGRVLYVGADDHWHPCTKRKGELNVATFSLDDTDSIVQPYPNRKSYEAFSKWLGRGERDYRFTILSDDKSSRRGNNLVFTAQYLIREYLKFQAHIRKIFLYMDGPISDLEAEFLRGEFQDFGRNFSVEGFPKIPKDPNKRGHKTKKYLSPILIPMADKLAYRLGNEKFKKIMQDPKFVNIDLSRIENMDELLKNRRLAQVIQK